MSFHITIKPHGAACNLACSYCFFLPKQQSLKSTNLIHPQILEKFIIQYIEAQVTELVVFTWQGGEPTLAGLDFFRLVVSLQKKHCPPGKIIANDLQTNGTLLNDEWCRFLKEHEFLVGLSIDGPERLHDFYRKTISGAGTFNKVMTTANLLNKYSIPFNTLTALHRQNSKYPRELYTFLRDEVGSQYMQFLPVVEPKNHAQIPPAYWPVEQLPSLGSLAATPGNPESFVTDWSVEPEDYGNFLCEVFDLWKNGDVGRVVVPLFECMLGIWSGQQATMCVFGNTCGHSFALDSDGSLYACDRFCFREYALGIIGTHTLAQLCSSMEASQFGKMKGAVASKCKACLWAFACKGECPKNRFLIDTNGELGLNYLCSGLQLFFAHIEPEMKRMASTLQN